MTDEPHPVTCPRCGGVLGHEDITGCLHVPGLGLVAHIEIVHTCGEVWYWHVNMRQLARLIERQTQRGV